MTPQLFATICFNILMGMNDGYIGKAPSYVEEKVHMLKAGYEAYDWLDRNNQLKVLGYLLNWKVELPEQIRKYEEEYAATQNTIKI